MVHVRVPGLRPRGDGRGRGPRGGGNGVAGGAVCNANLTGRLRLLDAGAASGSAEMGTSTRRIKRFQKKAKEAVFVDVPCAPLSALLRRAGALQVLRLERDLASGELVNPLAAEEWSRRRANRSKARSRLAHVLDGGPHRRCRARKPGRQWRSARLVFQEDGA